MHLPLAYGEPYLVVTSYLGANLEQEGGDVIIKALGGMPSAGFSRYSPELSLESVLFLGITERRALSSFQAMLRTRRLGSLELLHQHLTAASSCIYAKFQYHYTSGMLCWSA